MTGRRAIAIGDAREPDVGAIAAIYADHVRTGVGTFEERPRSAAAIARRLAQARKNGLPVLVAKRGRAVVGFAYASPYRTRSAYRYTVEDSVYVAAGCERLGVGRALLVELISRCGAAGLRQMVAVIGGADNKASIALHRRLGFRPVGILAAVGFKFGRWLDTVLMQRPLGRANRAPPPARARR